MNFAIPLSALIFVKAAVNVVFPWSTCPIVPIFTCGFLRSYFAFAIPQLLLNSVVSRWFTGPPLFAAILGDDGLRDLLRDLLISIEFHAVRGPALRARAKV